MRNCQLFSSVSKSNSSPARRFAWLTRSLRPLRRATSAGRRHSGGILGLAVHVLDLAHRDGRDRRQAGSLRITDGELGRHRTGQLRAPQRSHEGLERMAERVVDGCALEAAVRHAVIAPRVLADAVALPLGVLDERLIGRSVAFVGQQIAGPLPAEHVVCRIAPRRALIGLIAGEEVQEQAGVIERPRLARGSRTALKYLAKQLLARMTAEEYVLAGSVAVAVTGRNRDALDAETHGGVEEIGDAVRILAVEQRAIDGDAKTLAAREFDRGDRLVVHALLAHGLIVPLSITVEVNRERQVRRGLVLVDV